MSNVAKKIKNTTGKNTSKKMWRRASAHEKDGGDQKFKFDGEKSKVDCK